MGGKVKKLEKVNIDKFENFDLKRELSNYEIEHFTEFMKISNNKIEPFKVDINKSVNRIIEEIKNDELW